MDRTYLRDNNGVKVRGDCGGDAWADAHRTALGKGFYIQDVDAMFAASFFGMNTGEKLFLEYEPDHYENHGRLVRSFAVVAAFDRKANERAAFSSHNAVSTSLYLYQCRLYSLHQPEPARFFYVIGGQHPPWRMIELDINSGDRCGTEVSVDGRDWGRVWNALGLTRLRKELRQYIARKPETFDLHERR